MSADLLKEETSEENETVSSEKQRTKRKKKQRIRKFPIWLRIIVVLILFALSLVGGLMVGFGIIGDGSPMDALKVETYQHIIDIVQKEK